MLFSTKQNMVTSWMKEAWHTSIVFPFPGGPNSNSPCAGERRPTNSFINTTVLHCSLSLEYSKKSTNSTGETVLDNC